MRPAVPAMTAVWGACRVAAFVPLFHHVYTHFGDARAYLPAYALVVMLGVPALLFLLNLAWFARMARGAARMVRQRYPAKAAGRNQVMVAG